jgi:hypothetical protein
MYKVIKLPELSRFGAACESGGEKPKTRLSAIAWQFIVVGYIENNGVLQVLFSPTLTSTLPVPDNRIQRLRCGLLVRGKGIGPEEWGLHPDNPDGPVSTGLSDYQKISPFTMETRQSAQHPINNLCNHTEEKVKAPRCR